MRVRRLGRVSYGEAWDLQKALQRESDEEYLLLLEHPDVYTRGRHTDPANTRDLGVDATMVDVDRAGDVTFHGPGQLVGYPIVNVGTGPHRGPEHVRRVEQVVIDALVALGLDADDVGRLPGCPGVWVGLAGVDPAPRKIAAVGVRVARGRTMHGFGLNVTTDLAGFSRIVPCGISRHPVTSLEAEGWSVPIDEVASAVEAAAVRQWGPVESHQAVTPAGVDAPAGAGGATSALQRRLRRAGVDEAVDISGRKPAWMKVPVRMGEEFRELRSSLARADLVTVCEEAGCPNIYECWSAGTATFMINGSRCTRACGFCLIDTSRPLPLDPGEPARVADAVARLGLAHAVVTCVARDDLPDGGAAAFAATIRAIRDRSAHTVVEVLISDLKGERSSLDLVLEARPDVVNHNIETSARLQRAVRPSASYARSLVVLARAKDGGFTTKSGIIVGMGEGKAEVLATMEDLRAVGVDIITIGQYLRPTDRHVPVARWWAPEEFDELAAAGEAMGFAHVQASPLTRSSYHAREAADEARPAPLPARVPVTLGSKVLP